MIQQYQNLTSMINRIQLETAQDNDPEITALKAEMKSLESTHSNTTISGDSGDLQHYTHQL